jgi:hypothetical protein
MRRVALSAIVFLNCSITRSMSIKSTSENYARAAAKLREISTLSSISGLIGWDELVMLPEVCL